MTLPLMSETRAKEICQSNDLQSYTHDECRAADEWVRRYALCKFETIMGFKMLHGGGAEALKAFIRHMVRHHYGSVEVDDLLMMYNCYPDWLGIEEAKPLPIKQGMVQAPDHLVTWTSIRQWYEEHAGYIPGNYKERPAVERKLP